jgi:hypothetical protein
LLLLKALTTCCISDHSKCAAVYKAELQNVYRKTVAFVDNVQVTAISLIYKVLLVLILYMRNKSMNKRLLHLVELLKVNLFLFLISQELCHEDIYGSRGIAPPFLTSTLDGGEWTAFRPCRLTPGTPPPCTHCIGGWVGPRVGLDAAEDRKIFNSGS